MGSSPGGAQRLCSNPEQASTLSMDIETQETVGLGKPRSQTCMLRLSLVGWVDINPSVKGAGCCSHGEQPVSRLGWGSAGECSLQSTDLGRT